jgi:tetratricopeptide (TPR) repeat protein
MNPKKWGAVAVIAVLLPLYNMAQPDLYRMRSFNEQDFPNLTEQQRKKERYGPSLEWLDRMVRPSAATEDYRKLDFRVMSSMMLAGMASGFKSQVANLLWMKSDEYWHKGLMERQVPLMEMVVTLDPQFIDAWSTTGWHWAYNIFAEEPNKPQYKNDPVALRKRQNQDIQIGLGYLERGAAMNPETYRLWFEAGYHRAAKAGIYDEKTVRLLREAREKNDARTVEMMAPDPKTNKLVPTDVQGMDLVGRNIGHVYETIPDIDNALAQYRDLMRTNKGKGDLPTEQEMALLQTAGEAWGRYGKNYEVIVATYQEGDPTIKAQIKQMVPNIEQLVAAQAIRNTMAARESQATGAYVSIVARYMPTWKLMKAGKLEQAITTIIGVLNADTRYHLQGLPVYERVLAMRGDAPAAIQKSVEDVKQSERSSSQEIGLHLLARLYEQQGNWKMAHETWVRSRERNTLNFYGRRNSFALADKYNFKEPQHIIDAVKNSRRGGEPNAAPPMPGSAAAKAEAEAAAKAAKAPPAPTPTPAQDTHAGESADEHAGHSH